MCVCIVVTVCLCQKFTGYFCFDVIKSFTLSRFNVVSIAVAFILIAIAD